MRKNLALMVCAVGLAIVSAPASAQTPVLASQAPDVVAPAPPPQPAAPVVAAPRTVAPALMPAPPAPPAPPAASIAPAVAPAPPQPPAAPEPPDSMPQKPPTPPPPPKAPQAAQPAPAPRPTVAGEAQAPTPRLALEAPGRERIDTDPVNIRFEVTIGYQAGSAAPVRRTAVLTVANNTGSGFPTASLRSGNSVPVPTTTLTTKSEDGKETPAAKPIVSYNYRSVGLNVDVQQAAVVPGNRVRALLNVEFSGVDEKTASTVGAPSFPTFSQRISLYLENGKTVLVAESNDFADSVERKQSVEVKATILR